MTRRDLRHALRESDSQTAAWASLVGTLVSSEISTKVTSLRLCMRLIAVVASGEIRLNLMSRLLTLAVLSGCAIRSRQGSEP